MRGLKVRSARGSAVLPPAASSRNTGNVHLYDSLATVTRSLGLHALAPTPVSACPGLGVVEVCGWNARGCACPPIQQEWFRLEVHRDGIIIFDNARVIGLVWDKKCSAHG